MEVQGTLRAAKREWEHIRKSLEMCGDIGEFGFKNFVNNGSEFLTLLRNVEEMEKKFPICGYLSPEAAYVFAVLASKAVEKLGFGGESARAFGYAYGWVRTGFLEPSSMSNRKLIMQLFFYKLFFPLGENLAAWDFKSPVVKTKLKSIFDKFFMWQEEPATFIEDVVLYGVQLEPLWHGLSSAMGLPRKAYGSSPSGRYG